MSKSDFIKIKRISLKNTVKKIKTQAIHWEKIFTTYVKKDLLLEYTINSRNHNKYLNYKKCGRDVNRHFTKKEIWITNVWKDAQPD